MWLREPEEGQRLAALLPLDDDFRLRVLSLIRFQRRLVGRASGPPPKAWLITRRHRRRLILMVRALDGHLAEASYREIAACALWCRGGCALRLEDLLDTRPDDPPRPGRRPHDARRIPRAAARRLTAPSKLRPILPWPVTGMTRTKPSDSVIRPADPFPPPWPCAVADVRRPSYGPRNRAHARSPCRPAATLSQDPRSCPFLEPLRPHAGEASHLRHRSQVPEDRRPRRLRAR